MLLFIQRLLSFIQRLLTLLSVVQLESIKDPSANYQSAQKHYGYLPSPFDCHLGPPNFLECSFKTSPVFRAIGRLLDQHARAISTGWRRGANCGAMVRKGETEQGDQLMKLSDIEISELVFALGMERSAWIDIAKQEGRRHTEAEKVTMSVLAALEHALARAAKVRPFHDS